jgi:hypothetical protein
MADVGTTAVTVAVLEQDLQAAPRNLDTLCREAERAGMSVYAIPARWGGVLAGAPRVPSLFSAMNPETWVLDADGSPHLTGVSGVVSSIHHPATKEFFEDSLRHLLSDWPFAGLVFDEPRQLTTPDHSLAARERFGDKPDLERQVDLYADFFEELGEHAKGITPGLLVTLFTHCTLDGYPVERLARIGTLDCFGCAGRPWGPGMSDGEWLDPKVLLPNAERFLQAARRNSRMGMILIETQDVPSGMVPRLDEHLPEVLALGAEHIAYCYYPRNVDDADRLMEVMAKHLGTLA